MKNLSFAESDADSSVTSEGTNEALPITIKSFPQQQQQHPVNIYIRSNRKRYR
jgi:hypothetical protein